MAHKVLTCPACGKSHVDLDRWATFNHTTHVCQYCGHAFKTEPCIGVEQAGKLDVTDWTRAKECVARSGVAASVETCMHAAEVALAAGCQIESVSCPNCTAA